MSNIKFIIYVFLASLLEAINWGNKIMIWFINGLSLIFHRTTILLRKVIRPLHVLSIKELRKREKKIKKVKPIPVSIEKEESQAIVGSTKTVFIFELPDLPKPLETIELPLEEPQTPEELPFPDANEFEVEEGISEDEIRREMEESFYNPEYDDLSEEDTSGVSVEEIEQAYKVLHNEIMVETVKESIVVNVLNSLNGTDMFEMLINTEESDKMAKSIMDRYIKKHASGSGSEEDSKFNIGNYLEK